MNRLLVSLVALSFVTPAVAQVVPSTYENTPGTGVFLGPFTVGPRTYQLLMHEDLLTDMVGESITGISFRSPTSATSPWPAANATFTNYDVYLSGSVAPADRSLTFANNVVGPQTQVRSGPLVVAAGDLPSGGSPNDFGSPIDLTPWLYTGGHLLIEIRHAGNDQNSRSIDALTTSTSGYGSLFSAAWQSSYTATSGLQGNFGVIKFTTVPSPGALALLGGALVLAPARRRRV